jgi:hypothetical protein
MKWTFAAVAGALCLAMASNAAAYEVIYTDGGSTPGGYYDIHALPGAGTYQFIAESAQPLTFDVSAGYTYHWDVFLAPAPRPHADYIEGNDYPISDYAYLDGQGSTFTFVVPEMTRSFYPAPNYYELYGIAEGTALYEEIRYEDPYFTFNVTSDDAGESNYRFTVIRLTAVPEPGTWALLIGGFGLTGVMLRQRRKSLAAA